MKWNTPLYFLLLFCATVWMAFPQAHEPREVLPACALLLAFNWTIGIGIWLCRANITSHMAYQLILWMSAICTAIILLVYDYSIFKEMESEELFHQPVYQYWMLLVVPILSVLLRYLEHLKLQQNPAK